KQHAVNHAENRGSSADAEGEGKNGNDREDGGFAKLTKRKADVLPEMFSQNEVPHFSRFFLDPGYVAELSPSPMARRFGRHPAIDIPLCRQFDVFADLLIKIVQQPLTTLVHLLFSFGRRICVIAAASFSHLLVSTASCFRPLAVKR